MNSVILSVFVGILLVVCVQSQDNECSLKCRNNEFCYRREIGRLALETCVRYRGKGALCNDDRLKCSSQYDCKPRREGSSLRYCLDKSETTTSEGTTMTMTMPTTPTMMTTDMPTMSTDMPTMSTDMPTMSTDMSSLSTSKPTDMSTDTDDTTVATEETTVDTEETTVETEETMSP